MWLRAAGWRPLNQMYCNKTSQVYVEVTLYVCIQKASILNLDWA
jgi:hypothetical protein